MAATKETLEHVGYEWWMFRELYDLLDRLDEAPDPVRNALLEALTIHGRVLGRFFTTFEGRGKEEFNAEDHGVVLVAESTEMKEWRQESNGRVAHLLKARVQPKRDWKALEVRTFLENRVAELKARLGTSVPAEWVGDAPAQGSRLLNERPQVNLKAGSSGLFGGTGSVEVKQLGGEPPPPAIEGILGPDEPSSS